MYWDGIQDDYYVMVMGLLGPSLEELFNFCERRFTFRTVCMIASQCVERLRFMHDTGYIHRDIKPENITIGTGKKQNTFYLIDFGLTKRYLCPTSGQHVAHK